MKRICLLFLATALLVSCGPKKITDQQHAFKDKKWARSQVLTYAFNIEDTAARYDISASVKHFEDIQLNKIQLTFVLNDPSGEVRTTEHDLGLRDKEGRFTGQKVGDTLKMDFAIRNRYRFKAAGLAKVIIINRLPNPETNGIGAIGIKVIKR